MSTSRPAPARVVSARVSGLSGSVIIRQTAHPQLACSSLSGLLTVLFHIHTSFLSLQETLTYCLACSATTTHDSDHHLQALCLHHIVCDLLVVFQLDKASTGPGWSHPPYRRWTLSVPSLQSAFICRRVRVTVRWPCDVWRHNRSYLRARVHVFQLIIALTLSTLMNLPHLRRYEVLLIILILKSGDNHWCRSGLSHLQIFWSSSQVSYLHHHKCDSHISTPSTWKLLCGPSSPALCAQCWLAWWSSHRATSLRLQHLLAHCVQPDTALTVPSFLSTLALCLLSESSHWLEALSSVLPHSKPWSLLLVNFHYLEASCCTSSLKPNHISSAPSIIARQTRGPSVTTRCSRILSCFRFHVRSEVGPFWVESDVWFPFVFFFCF